LCACNQYSQQLSSVVVWIACLLACWLADKQIAERNKLLFLTLQQLDYIFIFFVHHHQHHHVFFFFFFFFFCTNLLLLSLWVLKNLPTFLFGSKFRWKFF